VNTPLISGSPTAGTSVGVFQQEFLGSNVTQKSVWIQQNSEFTAASDYGQLPGNFAVCIFIPLQDCLCLVL